MSQTTNRVFAIKRNMADITTIQESEYDAILRQLVAVIDRTKVMVATTICSAIGTEMNGIWHK